ncbi:MAG: HGGxSTG domain-containing protein [Blastocatellia bacterium]
MNSRIPHECTRICGARTRAGTPCKRRPNFTGRCSKHGGKSLAGIAHPNYKHGFYSKYLPRGWLLEASRRIEATQRKRTCTEMKADGTSCRQWAMRNDSLRRCVAHQSGMAEFERLMQRLRIPRGEWVVYLNRLSD